MSDIDLQIYFQSQKKIRVNVFQQFENSALFKFFINFEILETLLVIKIKITVLIHLASCPMNMANIWNTITAFVTEIIVFYHPN